jgi:hypothetical protein
MKQAAPSTRTRRPWALLLLLIVPAGALVCASVPDPDPPSTVVELPPPASAAPLARATQVPSAQASAPPPSNLAPCCVALTANQKSAPPQQAALYGMMAAACHSYKEQGMPYSKAAAYLQTMAGPAHLPAACRDPEVDHGW